jgi:hypothetical protein
MASDRRPSLELVAGLLHWLGIAALLLLAWLLIR